MRLWRQPQGIVVRHLVYLLVQLDLLELVLQARVLAGGGLLVKTLLSDCFFLFFVKFWLFWLKELLFLGALALA